MKQELDGSAMTFSGISEASLTLLSLTLSVSPALFLSILRSPAFSVISKATNTSLKSNPGKICMH